ncbi:MAG: hypothetical protein A3I06_11120 [Candidatus Lindowbacteria bacterium RIFCSPLOWO2_02_FULL_62_12]|nr:MAG: hypothetical protein A3I06_11120 [Candidatus Lindowbacteria bacterium RIFCSPLOWO2_02_FULL_62_12]
MLCKRCNKNEAKIHFAKIINNQTTEFHLCEPCAKQMNIMSANHEFNLENLIAGLAPEPEMPDAEESKLACSSCGLTAGQFKRSGRLGCPRCYETFHDELIPLLRKIHGSAHHTGKIPVRQGEGSTQMRVRDIKKLRRELRDAISREEYERAARIRDEIKTVEAEMKVRGGEA